MPQRVIAKTVFKVGDFLSWQRSNSLVLSPSFQRRPVWPRQAKSLLIDTIVRGIPMPIVFLREKIDLNTLEPQREVVDGQQRLRTIISYVEPRLLSDFSPERDSFQVSRQHNADLAGKNFSQLESATKTQILGYDFSVHILPSDTEDSEVLQIFARMNSTGVKLNHQELRNAEFYGAFKRVVYDLALEQLSRWRRWEVFNEDNIARMDEVELTSDFVRLMIEGIQGMSQTGLKNLYKKYEEDFEFDEEVTRRFRLTMDRIDEVLGNEIRTTVFTRKAMFESLFALFYNQLFGISSPLTRKGANPLPSNIVEALFLASNQISGEIDDDDLSKVLRGGTGNKESRLIRLGFLAQCLNATA